MKQRTMVACVVLVALTVVYGSGHAGAATVAYWELDGAAWDGRDSVGSYDLIDRSGNVDDSGLRVDPVVNPDGTLPWKGTNDAASNPKACWLSGSDDAYYLDPASDSAVLDTFRLIPGRSFTIEGWCRPVVSGQVVTARHANPAHQVGGNYKGWAVYTVSGGASLIFYADGAAAAGYAVVLQTPVVKNELVHFAGVYDGEVGENGTLYLYIDGELRESAAAPNTWGYTRGGALAIGARDTGSGFDNNPFTGGIDEIRYSDTALTPEEFLNYEPPVVAYWEFDGAAWDGGDAIGGYNLVKIGDSVDSTTKVDPVPNPDTHTPWLGANDAATNPFSTYLASDAYYYANPLATHDGTFDFDPNSSFTMEGWMSLGGTGVSWIVGNRTANAAHAYPSGSLWKGWSVQVQNLGQDLVFYIDGAAATGKSKQVTTTITPGEHIHFAGVWDAEAYEMRLYVDGELAGTTAGDSDWSFERGGQLSFGARDIGSGYDSWMMNGRLDEMRYSSLVLEPAEFLNAVPPCGTWGYWSADVNEDCYVDLRDLALLAGNWMVGS